MKNKGNYYQQGDVIMELVKEVKGRLNKDHNGIVAYGEATGHKHRFADLTGLDFFEDGDTLYLKLKNPSTIMHEEHGPIELPAGSYRIRIVEEYDHFAEEARLVID